MHHFALRHGLERNRTWRRRETRGRAEHPRDPAAGKGTRPESPFFPGGNAWQYPIHVLIDLGANRRLTRLFLYNESGESALRLSVGKPFAWKPQDITLSGYREWREFSLRVEIRYLRLTLTKPTSLLEIAVSAEDAEPVLSKPAMEQFIGTNAFIDDPLDTLAVPVGFVREYYPWQWDNEGKALYFPAVAALRYNPVIAALGERLRAKGVCGKQCVAAAMRKTLDARLWGSQAPPAL